MQVLWIDDETAISGPIGPDAVQRVAESGFRTIINNRPNNEEDHQPQADSIEFAARQHGLDYRFVPIAIRNLSHADVEAMRSALDQTPAPRVAFCRSGARSYILWALVNAESGADLERLIEQAADRGFDISAARRLAPD